LTAAALVFPPVFAIGESAGYAGRQATRWCLQRALRSLGLRVSVAKSVGVDDSVAAKTGF